MVWLKMRVGFVQEVICEKKSASLHSPLRLATRLLILRTCKNNECDLLVILLDYIIIDYPTEVSTASLTHSPSYGKVVTAHIGPRNCIGFPITFVLLSKWQIILYQLKRRDVRSGVLKSNCVTRIVHVHLYNGHYRLVASISTGAACGTE
jgi:hypothetical protein